MILEYTRFNKQFFFLKKMMGNVILDHANHVGAEAGTHAPRETWAWYVWNINSN